LKGNAMKRREFIQTTAGLASGLLLLKPATAFGYQNNSAVRHGLLGCGNRGTHVATSFSQNTVAQVVALADLFPDQLEAGHAHFNQVNTTLGRPLVDPKLLFHGPHAFEQLAASQDVDIIQISTPPFFHVEHLEAAVASGKHVYCEKPVGIDIKQAKQALEIAKRVKSTQSVDVGFQCRNAPPIAAIAEKIKAGALGKIASISAYYYAPASKEKVFPGARPDEYRLRNWLWDRALSGDILVEQNIHIIDLCNWILGRRPLKAAATGGRNILTHAGDCWDNYQVDYLYPNDVRVSFASKQFGDYDMFEAGLRLFGSEGAATIPYAGPVEIAGTQKWAWQDSTSTSAESGKFAANGNFEDNLAFADRDKERTFIESIVNGPVHNQIAAGVETALSCMLGRMAGLRHQETTWDELQSHGETYKLGMDLAQFA
jgi:predicted dehydrogenase